MYLDFDKRHFLISLSFSGDKRPFIATLSNFLRDFIGEDNIFYDYFYEGELSGPDLDLKLQKVYGVQSDIVAVFVSQAYQTREWCFGVEWRVIRDLIKRLEKEKVMFLRFDNSSLEGLLSIDGYIDIGKRSPQEIGTILLKRLQNKGKFIIPKNDEVVIRIQNSDLSADDLQELIDKIEKISGRKFLIYGIEKGSTILKIGMFDQSQNKLLSWVKDYKKIGKFSVTNISVNDIVRFEIKQKITYRKDRYSREQYNKNRLQLVLDGGGITQAQLSKAAGISATTINIICNNKNKNPREAIKVRIVNTLKILTGKEYTKEEIFPTNVY